MTVTQGQKLYTWNETEVVVSKVGKKYFYLEGDIRMAKFDLESLKYTSPLYSQNDIQLYNTLQEVLDLKERKNLISLLADKFGHHRKQSFTLEQLRETVKILGI